MQGRQLRLIGGIAFEAGGRVDLLRGMSPAALASERLASIAKHLLRMASRLGGSAGVRLHTSESTERWRQGTGLSKILQPDPVLWPTMPRTLAALSLALSVLVSGAAVYAQPKDIEIAGVHIVRPGDTLRHITARYLGSQERWTEIWGLNPSIENPDFLLPGQRVKVLLRPAKATPTARILTVSGQVEDRPAPNDWTEALRADLLVERDGLRTFDSSSSALEFPDGSELVVSERSLVFMRRAGRTLRGLEDRQLEIVEGQADLESQQLDPAGPEIEIIVGSALATPKADESGAVQARARKIETGGAAVMVFAGESEVAAGGQTVAVTRGMGTAVPAEGPPTPPEQLLDAPSSTAPTDGSRLDFPDPVFSWGSVAGAVGYVVEICSDSGCRQLVHRETVKTTDWRSRPLPVADLFWRVSAVSDTGLDGYSSESLGFSILSDRLDREAPKAVATLEGPSIAREGKTFFAPETRVLVQIADSRTGVPSWSLHVNGEEVGKQRLMGPWADGRHRVVIFSQDGAGNRGEDLVAEFIVDAEPPEIVTTAGDREVLAALVDNEAVDPRRAKNHRRWLRRASRRPGPSGLPWVVVAWDSAEFDALDSPYRHPKLRRHDRNGGLSISTSGDNPRIALLAPTVNLDGQSVGDRILRISTEDGKSGVMQLSVRSSTGKTGSQPALIVEAADRLLNRRTLCLPGS